MTHIRQRAEAIIAKAAETAPDPMVQWEPLVSAKDASAVAKGYLVVEEAALSAEQRVRDLEARLDELDLDFRTSQAKRQEAEILRDEHYAVAKAQSDRADSLEGTRRTLNAMLKAHHIKDQVRAISECEACQRALSEHIGPVG